MNAVPGGTPTRACLYCGETIPQAAKICPFCQSALDGTGPPPPIPPAPAGAWSCPVCRQSAGFVTQNEVSTTGWIVFIVLALTCILLCWIGLFIKEPVARCASCRSKITR